MWRRLLWPVLVPSLLVGVARGATAPVMVLAALHLGASASLAAALVGLVGAVGLLTTVPAGSVIDRVGDRLAMLVSTAAVALLTVLAVVALTRGGVGSLPLFVASIVLMTPATNVWSLARQAYVAEHLPQHQVGRAMTALGGTMRAGNLIGPLLTSLLLLRLPLWSAYVLTVAFAALALLVLWLAPDLASEGSAPATGASTGPATPTAAGPPPGTVRWRIVVLVGVAIAALALARTNQVVAVQLWGVHVGLTASQISLLVAVGAAVELVLMFPGGYLKDRLGRTPVLVTCLTVYGTGFVALVLTSGFVGALLAVLVMSVGNGLGAGINMTIGADLSPPVGRARFLGIWALFSNVGGLLGPGLVSLLVAGSGTAVAVAASGGVALAGALWMLLVAGTVALPRGVSASR